MLALVTGAAGFIGSTLVDQLLSDGWDVRGVDRFTAYYEEEAKRSNVAESVASSRFHLIEADLLHAELTNLLHGVDVVFHLAAQPGVRLSWSDGFALYNELNVNVTQRLLEGCRDHPTIRRVIYASSSSIYGNSSSFPTREDSPTRPHSPYGVTKYAGELLCRAYHDNFAVPTISLRYFTVYGPRQRPDMAIHRMIESARTGREFPLFGDGSNVRDFTYVGDVARANIAAASADVSAGAVINIAGGSSTTVSDLISLVGETVGSPVNVSRRLAQAGDVQRTGGDISAARDLLGWQPIVTLAQGVSAQVAWHATRDA